VQNNELYIAIFIMSIANLITRLIPFIFFSKKEPPKLIEFIATYFPPIIMIILIFYTLTNIDFFNSPYGLKELFAIFITIFLHLKFNNYLVSIVLGTISYMIVLQIL